MRPDETQPPTVFVYGTLMPGERNAPVALAAGRPARQEQATLTGHTLRHLHPEGYPALTPGVGSVHGWLLHYGPEQWPAALRFLDELEGLHLTPPLYTREQALARTARGMQAAWVYVYARPERFGQPGCELVLSGDWTQVPDRHSAAPDSD